MRFQKGNKINLGRKLTEEAKRKLSGRRGKNTGRSKNKRHIKKLNRDRIKERRIELRYLVLGKYGGECKCCGETIPEFLTIDHIKRDGKQERKELTSSFMMYYSLNKRPIDRKRYRILCMNCNFATRFGKKCPHTWER